MYKSRSVQSFSIFGSREGFIFEFTILSGVWKIEKKNTRPGPPVSCPHGFQPRALVTTFTRSPLTWSPCGDCTHSGERVGTGHHRSPPLPMPGRPYPTIREGSLPISFLLPHCFNLSPLLYLACACRSARHRAPPSSNSVSVRAKEPHLRILLKV
jgi:hypothetical protein